MATYRSPLRDLAIQLRNTAREHIAYSQVAEFMNHMDTHLSALAYAEETNQEKYTAKLPTTLQKIDSA